MIGENIRRLRTAAGMTQKDLADKLFVTAQAVSRWEKEEVEPSIPTISEMANIFGVSTDELLGIQQGTKKEEEKTPPPPEPILALCEECNTPLYKTEDIFRETLPAGSSRVLCPRCEKKRRERARQEAQIKQQQMLEKVSKNRRRGWIIGGLAATVFLISGITSAVSGDTKNLMPGILCAVCSFTLIGCLFLKNNFIGDAISTIFQFGFVRFPGLIFTCSLGGFIWAITMKLLFWILGIAVALLAGFFGIVIGGMLSVFVYPFALAKSYHSPADFDDI